MFVLFCVVGAKICLAKKSRENGFHFSEGKSAARKNLQLGSVWLRFLVEEMEMMNLFIE